MRFRLRTRLRRNVSIWSFVSTDELLPYGLFLSSPLFHSCPLSISLSRSSTSFSITSTAAGRRLSRRSIFHESSLDVGKSMDDGADFFREFGGTCQDSATKREASEIIERLLAGPTVRQRMVLRFWNQPDLMSASAADVSAWMDNWYAEDPHRLDAWALWKRESGEDGGRSPKNIDIVPIGAGEEYLARVKAGASTPAPVIEMASGPAPPVSRRPLFVMLAIVVVVVLATFAMANMGYISY